MISGNRVAGIPCSYNIFLIITVHLHITTKDFCLFFVDWYFVKTLPINIILVENTDMYIRQIHSQAIKICTTITLLFSRDLDNYEARQEKTRIYPF